jgi:UDP-glucose 4-epimerase
MTQNHTCVVLGGSGFLGQCLCARLVSEGFRVISVSRSGAPAGVEEEWCSKVEWVAATMGSEKSLALLHRSDFVFHLASSTLPSTSNSDMAFDLESNLIATVRFLEAAAAATAPRIVFVSSGGTVYGIPKSTPIDEDHPTHPICSYGIHKLAIEKYLHLFHCTANLDSIVLRVANIYGESQDPRKPLGAVSSFVDKSFRRIPIEIWGDGSVIRDYVHVDDVVNALVDAIAYRGSERLFNIGTGRGVSLRQLVEMIRLRIDGQVATQYSPSRRFDVQENVLNVSRACDALLWTPVITLEVGLDRMIHMRQAQSSIHPQILSRYPSAQPAHP